MPALSDDEFGTVTIRRSKLARNVRLSLAPNGTLRISMPVYAPLFLAKRLINSSRDEIRELLSERKTIDYSSESWIGKSHRLVVQPGQTLKVHTHKQVINLTLPQEYTLQDDIVRDALREPVIAALRREAKSYLPHRLAFLAEKHGFEYTRVRFSHASTRWGSCSSEGTISLNIALMRLDFSLIDYVLIHELCHTKEMNHSPRFWEFVESIDPDYKAHRRKLKLEMPSI